MKTKFLLIPCLVAITNGLFAQYEILDNTFGSQGILTTDFSGSHEAINSVALQGDGKIVVAGYSTAGIIDDNFALARYNTNGTLDASFSMDGKLTTDFGGFDQAQSVAIQEDGKIVAAGFTNIGCPDFHFAIARYNSDGTLDTGFGTDGKLITSFNTNWAEAHSVFMQKDGKIVAAGLTRMYNVYTVTNEDFALARYNPDGTLDSSFNSDGKLTTDFDSAIDVANSAIIQEDGKIVVAGYSGDGPTSLFTLARYNPDGTLDGTFGTDGKQTTEFRNTDMASSVALQSDERIVVAGYTGGDNYDFALARYNTDGSIDNTFGIDGKVTTALSEYDNDFARSVVIQSDGKIVGAGYSPSLGFNFALVRYNSDGTLDITFSPDGRLLTNIGSGDDRANSIAVQTDGKIVAVGTSYNGTDYDFALARYATGGNVAIPELPSSGNSLSIFPNPTTGVFEIQNSSLPIETAEAFNFLGEKVFSTFTLEHSNSIDFSLQPEGVYFLHLKTEEGIVVKKVVISR